MCRRDVLAALLDYAGHRVDLEGIRNQRNETLLDCAVRSGSIDSVQQLALRGVDIKGNADLSRVAADGHLDLLRHLVFVQQCDLLRERRGVTPLPRALGARQADCANWLIRNGAVAQLSARMAASPTGRDVQLDERLLHALIEAHDDGVLAALVY
jgi:ankyrin repeat protein